MIKATNSTVIQEIHASYTQAYGPHGLQVDIDAIAHHLNDPRATLFVYHYRDRWFVVIKHYPMQPHLLFLSLCTVSPDSICSEPVFKAFEQAMLKSQQIQQNKAYIPNNDKELFQYKKIVWGQDDAHIYYGIPAHCSATWDNKMAEQWGWSLGTKLYDMTSHTHQQPPPLSTPYRVSPYDNRYGESFKYFLHTEFPGRWYRDMIATTMSTTAQQDILLLLKNIDTSKHTSSTPPKQDYTIEGFARLTNNKSTIKNPSLQYTKNKHAVALGPIGIARTSRGKGLGKLLLNYCLYYAHSRKTKLVIADWVQALDFYSRCGFIVQDSFISLSKIKNTHTDSVKKLSRHNII